MFSQRRRELYPQQNKNLQIVVVTQSESHYRSMTLPDQHSIRT